MNKNEVTATYIKMIGFTMELYNFTFLGNK